MEEIMLQVKDVCKQYKLGQIGGSTLREELQRFNAKLLKKEDPTRKVEQGKIEPGAIFNALNNVSFEIKKGERVGIIGHNGAGKSTILKLISRVTAPTSGTISFNGRVASMLEVGTGFHGELTGRENIYMNGSILGMKKSEIDEKIEDIITFSECSQFIDTPVKRYSSGMYVKLAFSVMAHLDSEILIMDEVLAVGDMAFQKKCLDKMNDVSRSEGRTVLYVSHNMNTIRQLCERCIVLDHGEIVFDGDVEEAINVYMASKRICSDFVNLNEIERNRNFNYGHLKMIKLELDNKKSCYSYGDDFSGKITFKGNRDFDNVHLMMIFSCNGQNIMSSEGEIPVNFVKDKETQISFSVGLMNLAPASYSLSIFAVKYDEYGNTRVFDLVRECYSFDIVKTEGFNNNHYWNNSRNGFFIGDTIEFR